MTSVSGSIGTALGIGSGIDTKALVSQLVSATRDPKEKVILDRQSLNKSRISALASAANSLDTFADALNSLLSSTGYSGVPASNDPSVAAVSALPGGTPKGLPAQLEVISLATARTVASEPAAGKVAADVVGKGELTLTVGGVPKSIVIDDSNNSYTGLAAAINGAGMGVTASVVTDTRGTRLVMKGATGAANDFSLASVSGDDLAKFAWAGQDSATMVSTGAPADAIIKIDGVEQQYASNTIDSAIAYLRIDLNKAAPGSKVTLGMTEPTTSMRDLVVEFVSAYNTMMKALNTATATGTDSSTAGVLNGEASVRDMKRQLSSISSTALASSGPFKALSDIGVGTNRDGTLTLDTKALDRAMAANPSAITQMLNPPASSAGNLGLAGLMDSVRDKIKQKDGPLAQAQAKYDDISKTLSAQYEKLSEQMTGYEAQLTKTYSAMETRLTALKATQSYLEQQIAMWNKSDN